MRHCKTLGLAAVALALLAGPAHAQTTLRYKFKSGEKLQYGLSQDMKMTMNVMGMDIEVKLKQLMDMDWDIQKVDEQGNAQVRLTFGHVRLKLDSPTGNAEFDSKKSTEEPEDPIGKVVAQLAKGLAALEMTFTMAPNGEMKDIKIPEAALKKLKEIPGADKLGGDMLSPEGLSKMAGGGLVFPKGPVNKGKNWTQKISLKMPFGKMAGDMKYTYEGPVEKDGKKLEKIAVQPNLKIELDPDAPAQIKIKSQKDKGHAYFDNQAGRLVEVTNEGTMEMELEVGGMTFTQNINQSTSLRLKSRTRPK
jgi:hypothetical protein